MPQLSGHRAGEPADAEEQGEQVQGWELSGGPGRYLWGRGEGSLKAGVSEQKLEGQSLELWRGRESGWRG